MSQTAVIGGVGPGLGESLARKFVSEGCAVGLLARSDEYLKELADDLAEEGGEAIAAPADIAHEGEVEDAFDTVREAFGEIDLLVNHASKAAWEGVESLGSEDFQSAWEVTALGAFHCSKEAIPDMLDAGGGTILFTGATSAIRGRDGAAGFSSAKFAARGLAESMARELGPKGIHVAHVIIDGQILTPEAMAHNPDRDEETYLDPDEIAETYWHLVEQDRSTWTLELDLRPYVEDF